MLQDFLKTNVLTSAQLEAKTDAASLRAAVNEAAAMMNPSAALQGAIDRAETELNVNTTDPYRLYQRLSDIEAAKETVVKGLSLMPKEFVSDTPVAADGVSSVRPNYKADGSVELYKDGKGMYWPIIDTPIDETVDVDETPYLFLDVAATASFNAMIVYRRADGEMAQLQVSELAGKGANDFAPCKRQVISLDFGDYVRKQGHVGDNGLVKIVSCQMYVVGSKDQVVQMYECGFADQAVTPTKLSGTYAVANGMIDGLTPGMTAATLKAAMDYSDLLSVTDQSGNAVSGKIGTGMTLTMTVNGNAVDSAVVIVCGDVDGDGDANTADARLAMQQSLGGVTLNSAAKTAADTNRNGSVDSADVRAMLLEFIA